MLASRSRGTSLVEVLIAVILLVFVILGMLAAVVIARGMIYHKVYEEANQVAFRVLETIEATPYSDLSDKEGQSTVRGFDVSVSLEDTDLGAEYSQLVRVEVAHKGGMSGKAVVMEREVSANGWQNVGEYPKN